MKVKRSESVVYNLRMKKKVTFLGSRIRVIKFKDTLEIPNVNGKNDENILFCILRDPLSESKNSGTIMT